MDQGCRRTEAKAEQPEDLGGVGGKEEPKGAIEERGLRVATARKSVEQAE